MPIVFKYNNPVNVSYAPGVVETGDDGSVGANGEPGNSIYFTNFEFDNSYNIELALQKIENNYILSDDNFTQIKSIREYKVNDLILSTSGNCYRIISSQDESIFKNYKFNIEYIGTINKASIPSITKVQIKNITNWFDTEHNIHYNSEQELPVNYVNKHNNSGVMYGNWYEIQVFGELSSPDYFYTNKKKNNEFAPGAAAKAAEAIQKIINTDKSAIRVSIELQFKNVKSYTTNCNPTEDGINFEFYKSLKFSNLDIYAENDTENNNQFCAKKIVYISDCMLDRMHPSGNNIACTLDNSKSMWYKTGIRGENNIITDNFNLLQFKEGVSCDEDVNKYESSGLLKEDFIDNNTVFKEGDEEIHINNVDRTQNLPKYSMGAQVNAMSDVSIQINEDCNVLSAIQEKINSSPDNLLLKEKENNFAGSSIYFSRNTQNEMEKIINSYISSSDTAIITVKNLSTKEISIVEAPIEYLNFNY